MRNIPVRYTQDGTFFCTCGRKFELHFEPKLVLVPMNGGNVDCYGKQVLLSA